MTDIEILIKLAGGDLIVLEVKYHNNCTLMYRNCVRSELRKNNPAVLQNV